MINNIAFALNLITLIMDIFTCLISLGVSIITIHHVCFNRIKQDDRAVICVSANIYPVIFIFTIISVSFHIQTLLGDLYEQIFNSVWCSFIGYISYVILNMFYSAFINQVIKI